MLVTAPQKYKNCEGMQYTTLSRKWENQLDGIDRFLERYTLPKLIHEEIVNQNNKPVTKKMIRASFKIIKSKKNPDGFTEF